MFFLLVWFLMQVLSGAASLTATQAMAGGVAWWAHIGGFVSGMVLGVVLSTRTRVLRTSCGNSGQSGKMFPIREP
jgi:membrane associated rhomboid family serine protease